MSFRQIQNSSFSKTNYPNVSLESYLVPNKRSPSPRPGIDVSVFVQMFIKAAVSSGELLKSFTPSGAEQDRQT